MDESPVILWTSSDTRVRAGQWGSAARGGGEGNSRSAGDNNAVETNASPLRRVSHYPALARLYYLPCKQFTPILL